MIRPICCALFFFAGCVFAAGKPNVILMMCDDLGWGDVGFNGNTIIQTPHLDAMAQAGLQFNRFYAAAPVCSPTRGSCLTGRHPHRYGIPYANTGHLKAEETTLPEVLKEKGYATGHFGKWHLGTLTTTIKDANRGKPGNIKDFSPPQQHGYDRCFVTESKVPTYDPMDVPAKFKPGENRKNAWDSVGEGEATAPYGTHYFNERGEVVTDHLKGDDSKLIMDRAIPFIESAVKEEKPFFAAIWFHAPHLPVVAGPEHRAMYKDHDVHDRNYYGCITAIDDQVGRLRAKLKDIGASEHTLFWFCSDNGPEGGDKSPGRQGEYRGRKRSLYEGGVRVPGLLEWPAQIKSHRSTEIPCVTSDYFPTVLEILGHKLSDPHPYDGVSLLPLIKGSMKERARPIGFQSRGTSTLSGNRFKIVLSGGKDKKGKPTAPAVELYDLLADPGEQNNLAAQHPEVSAQMQKQLTEWIASCAHSNTGGDYK